MHRVSADTPPLGDRAKSSSFGNLAYQYSSSEESLFKERLKKGVKQTEVTRIQESDSEVSVADEETRLAATPRPNSTNLKEKEVVGSKPSSPIDNIPSCCKIVMDLEKDCKPDVHPTVEEELGSLSSSEQESSRQSVGPLIYLSAKLLELSNCLGRFRRHATDELHAAKEHLADVKKKLVEYPPGEPTIDAISTQATIVMMVVLLLCIVATVLYFLFLLSGLPGAPPQGLHE